MHVSFEIAALFMPELSIAQLVGIYISILYFVYTLIERSLERHLEMRGPFENL